MLNVYSQSGRFLFQFQSLFGNLPLAATLMQAWQMINSSPPAYPTFDPTTHVLSDDSVRILCCLEGDQYDYKHVKVDNSTNANMWQEDMPMLIALEGFLVTATTK